MEINERALTDWHTLKTILVRRLRNNPCEFPEQMRFIREKNAEGEKWSASGVLVPLEMDAEKEEFVVILNKRSIHVQQPGDLCCPGGGLERKLDNPLSRLLAWRILPATRTRSFRLLLHADKRERNLILQVFAGVLRESWEEMRLKPWNVEYLGILPSHPLHNFSRVIFPVVGRIRGKWKPRMNWEVEKVIRLPLRAFFEPDNYAFCKMRLPPGAKEKFGVDSWEIPCLVVFDGGEEEILWGATFRILLIFMEKVFDLPVERIHPERKIHKKMPENYYPRKSDRGTR